MQSYRKRTPKNIPRVNSITYFNNQIDLLKQDMSKLKELLIFNKTSIKDLQENIYHIKNSPTLENHTSKLETIDTIVETQTSKLETIDTILETQNSKLEIIDTILETQDSKLEIIDTRVQPQNSK